MNRSFLSKSVLTVPLAALALAVSSAYAAPVIGPSGSAFYNAPAEETLTGNHGDLISYRPTTANLGAGAPATKAWNVIYQSQNIDEIPTAVSGTVLVPTAAWAGTGARPVIVYAVGTHGLANKCAPSRRFEAGDDYESANIAAALKAGYAVLVTDYAGYLSGQTPSYIVGSVEGRNLLDMFTAALSIPQSGIDASAKVGIWGFSQGGQASASAGEIQSSLNYAPKMNLVGISAGGVPGDLPVTAKYLNASTGSSFLFATVIGLQNEYTNEVPLDLLTNDLGKAELANLKTQCVFEALFKYRNQDISKYTNGNQSLDTLLNFNKVPSVLKAETLGTKKINVPLYNFHGQADEFIPLGQALALRKKYCALGTNVTFDLYDSEHIVTQYQAALPSLAFLADRFAGKAATGNCNSTTPDPISTANPGGGDFIVSLNKWPLTASLDLKGLKQTVTLPATSTFTAQANVSTPGLTGDLSVPDFSSRLKIIGINAQVALQVTPVGKTTGTASVDNDGKLHIAATAKTDITVASVWGINFGACKTQTPVSFDLKYDGPLSALGYGIPFTGTTTFPQIKGCIISAIISALMSGPGQVYNFNVAPPAPKRF
jgi:hypothetical protein